MNNKMRTNSQLSTNEPKKQKQSKQLEEEQNHRNWYNMDGYQQGGRGGRMTERLQGIRNIIGRHKINKGRLRIVWEMEKPKNLYIQSMDMN